VGILQLKVSPVDLEVQMGVLVEMIMVVEAAALAVLEEMQ